MVDLREVRLGDETSVMVVDGHGPEGEVRSLLAAAGFRVLGLYLLHDAIELLGEGDVDVDVVVVGVDRGGLGAVGTIDVLRSVSTRPVVLVLDDDAAEVDDRGGSDVESDQATIVVRRGADPMGVVDAVHEAVGLSIRAPGAPGASADLATSRDAKALADTVVAGLASWSGLGTWLFTRVVGDDWFVIAAHDEHYGVQAGDVLRWSDSFCSRMVEGRGPRVVTDTGIDDSYGDAPIGHRLDIGTYIGVPIVTEEHGLFGTLCGIDPEPRQDGSELAAMQPAIELLARNLAANVALDMQASRLERRLELTEAAARNDVLTGLGNRRSWLLALRAEDARCERFGHQASVIVIDLDGLKLINDDQGHKVGDVHLRRTADVLRRELRSADHAFRTGGDEFAVLLPETGREEASVLLDRLRTAFARAGISACFGLSVRWPGTSLEVAAHAADVMMYEAKRMR